MKRLTEKDMWDIIATDIKWDVYGEENAEELLEELPEAIVVTRAIDENDVSDYLSLVTGFCHDGYVEKVAKSISKLAYQLYIIDWKHSYVINHDMEADAWKNYFMETDAEDMRTYSFEEFLWNAGYGSGSLYVCYDEFLGAEYLDEEYIKELLDSDELYDMYLEDLKNRSR